MSVPSKRRSRSRTRRGRSHQALKKPKLVLCSHCKKRILPHHACPYCGYYKKRQIVQKKKKTKRTKNETE